MRPSYQEEYLKAEDIGGFNRVPAIRRSEL